MMKKERSEEDYRKAIYNMCDAFEEMLDSLCMTNHDFCKAEFCALVTGLAIGQSLHVHGEEFVMELVRVEIDGFRANTNDANNNE